MRLVLCSKKIDFCVRFTRIVKGHVTFLDPIGLFFSRVSRSVPFSKKKDPRAGRGSYKVFNKGSMRKDL